MTDQFYKFYVIGDPIDHSLSPQMHNLFLKHFQIPGEYCARRVKTNELKPTLSQFIHEGIVGINVTTPLKQEILKFIDELTPEARVIGSVNTVKFNHSKIIGHNTDAIGFQNSLRQRKFSVNNKNALVFGAGGAARAVIMALIKEHCKKIVVINRNWDKATTLIDNFSKQFPRTEFRVMSLTNGQISDQIKSCHLLVNATTIGMGELKDSSVLSNTDGFHNDLLVYDLIYRPCPTKLIQQAQACHVPWINGLEMLIFQGFESLKFWLGRNLTLDESWYLEVKEILRRELCQE